MSKTSKKGEEKRLNLVLDLDNTIILCKMVSKEEKEIKGEEMLKKRRYLTSFEDDLNVYYIYERPYLSYFISTVSNIYNIYVYTNAHRKYCELVLEALKRKYPQLHINNYVAKKDIRESNMKSLYMLEIITGHQVEHGFFQNTIILDDRKDIWPLNLKNLIMIKPYYELEIDDEELLGMTIMMSDIKKEYDILLKKKSLYNVQILLDKIKSNNNI